MSRKLSYADLEAKANRESIASHANYRALCAAMSDDFCGTWRAGSYTARLFDLDGAMGARLLVTHAPHGQAPSHDSCLADTWIANVTRSACSFPDDAELRALSAMASKIHARLCEIRAEARETANA